jgi:hypothetical protein
MLLRLGVTPLQSNAWNEILYTLVYDQKLCLKHNLEGKQHDEFDTMRKSFSTIFLTCAFTPNTDEDYDESFASEK